PLSERDRRRSGQELDAIARALEPQARERERAARGQRIRGSERRKVDAPRGAPARGGAAGRTGAQREQGLEIELPQVDLARRGLLPLSRYPEILERDLPAEHRPVHAEHAVHEIAIVFGAIERERDRLPARRQLVARG